MLTPGSIGRELGATGFGEGYMFETGGNYSSQDSHGQVAGRPRSPSYQAETIAQHTEF